MPATESLDSLLADLDTIASIAQAGVLSRRERQLEPGETRPAAVVFIDVVGFTVLARQLTSEQLGTLIDRTFRIFEITVRAHGGYCDKVIGDAALYVFAGHPNYPPPVRSALSAALKLLERARQVSESLASTGMSIAIRAGVSFGEVTRQRVGGETQQLTVMGDTVNLAQRLENSAQPGTVQTTIRVLDQAGGGFSTEEAGKLELKGFGPVGVYRVTGEQEAEVQLRGTGQLSPLTGRDALLAQAEAQLAAWLDEPPQPAARVLVLRGVAAVGKSRLAYELAQRLAARYPRLSGATAHCTENTPPNVFTAELAAVAGLTAENLPERWEQLCALAEAEAAAPSPVAAAGNDAGQGAGTSAAEYAARARRHLPLLAWVLGCRSVDTSGIRQADPASFLLGCRLALCACCELAALESGSAGVPAGLGRETEDAGSKAAAPVVLVVEDLQWAGELTGLLAGLLSGVHLSRPLLLIATARPEYEADATALAALLGVEQPAAEAAPPWAAYELPPLSSADGDALLDALLPGLVLPPDIAEELHEKASGLPYYYEEFARMLLRRGIVAAEGAEGSGFRVQGGKRAAGAPVEEGARPAPSPEPEAGSPRPSNGPGRYVLTQELTELALPEDIQALLLGRLDMLPQELKELTMRASVLGRSFDRDLLARVHELLDLQEARPLDDQLSELVAERVLVRDEGEG
jgi:class 3 adenylate cyclase